MVDIEIKSLAKLFTILLLSENERYGYEIMKEIGNKLGKKFSPGQMYPFLRQLKKHNYIRSRGRTERDKQVYYLTSEGRDFVGRLSKEFSNLLDIAVKQRLTLCAHCDCKIYEGGYRQKTKGRYLDFCCENCARNYLSMK